MSYFGPAIKTTFRNQRWRTDRDAAKWVSEIIGLGEQADAELSRLRADCQRKNALLKEAVAAICELADRDDCWDRDELLFHDALSAINKELEPHAT